MLPRSPFFSSCALARRPASAEIEMLARRHFGARPGNFLFRHPLRTILPVAIQPLSLVS